MLLSAKHGQHLPYQATSLFPVNDCMLIFIHKAESLYIGGGSVCLFVCQGRKGSGKVRSGVMKFAQIIAPEKPR